MRKAGGKRVVIVGAGVAGLTAAALLARAGYQVTVLEKGRGPGGRAAQFTREGFTFDLGPTLLFMPHVFREAFAACGADFDAEVELQRLRTNYRLHFPDGRTLTLSPVLSETMASLEQFEPGTSAGLLAYLAGAARAYEDALTHFVGSRLRSSAQFLHPRNIAALVRSGAFRSMRRTARRHFRSQQAASALSFQSMYLGMSPYASPELYRLLFFTEMGEGIFFPRGGIGALVRALERLALRCGAEIRYECEVRDTWQAGDRVTHVLAIDGEHACDAALFTADLPFVYERILRERGHRSTRMRLTPSALLLYVALEERYAQMLHHEFLMPADLRATCRDIFREGRCPDDPAIYLAAPSASDPGMAPPGKEALYVLVPVPNLLGNTDWESGTGEYTERVLERIETRLLPGLRSRIRWYETRTPLDFQRELHLQHGSAFGLSHDLLQIGPLRPDTRHRRLKNLYFAGASTRPATGLPLVTLSAMQTAERIREEIA